MNPPARSVTEVGASSVQAVDAVDVVGVVVAQIVGGVIDHRTVGLAVDRHRINLWLSRRLGGRLGWLGRWRHQAAAGIGGWNLRLRERRREQRNERAQPAYRE